MSNNQEVKINGIVDNFRVYWIEDNYIQHCPIWGNVDYRLNEIKGEDFFPKLRELRKKFYDDKPLSKKEEISFKMVKLPSTLKYKSRYTGFTRDKNNLTYLWCEEFGVIPELLIIENGLKYEIVDEIKLEPNGFQLVQVLNYHSICISLMGYSFYLYGTGEVDYLTKGISHVPECVSTECDSIDNAVKIITAYCQGQRDCNTHWQRLMAYMGEKGSVPIPYDDD